MKTNWPWLGRGGRLMGRGFRLMWAGPLIVPVLLIAAAARATRPVIVALLILLIVIFLIGLVIVSAGYLVIRRGMPERRKQVVAPGASPLRIVDRRRKPGKPGKPS